MENRLSLERVYRDGLEPFRTVFLNHSAALGPGWSKNKGIQLGVNVGSYYNYHVAGTGRLLGEISEASRKYQD